MAGSGLETKGFLGSLFDFSFTSFVTLRFLRVIYALLVVLILLAGLAFFIAGLASGEAAGIAGAFIVVPLATLLYLVFARIYMEIIALFFRIGENTNRMAALMGSGPAPGYGGPAGPGRSGPPPQPGAPYDEPSPYGPPQA